MYGSPYFVPQVTVEVGTNPLLDTEGKVQGKISVRTENGTKVLHKGTHNGEDRYMVTYHRNFGFSQDYGPLTKAELRREHTDLYRAAEKVWAREKEEQERRDAESKGAEGKADVEGDPAATKRPEGAT